MAEFGVEEEREFREEIRAFLSEHPVHHYTTAHDDLGYGFGAWSADFLRAVGTRGWIGLLWPTECGGKGLPPRALWVLLTELAYGRAPAEALFYALAVGQCIVTYGSPELRATMLPSLLGGDVTFAEALSEPDAGSDLFSLRTRASLEDDAIVVSGQKIWTSNGAVADYAMVLARTGSEMWGHRGLSAILVDLRDPTVERRPILDATGQPSFSEIFFNETRVPVQNVLGDLHAGLDQVLDALAWDRFWARATKAPFLRREWEDLYAAVVTPSASGATAWDSEWVRLSVADLATDIEACDALCEAALPLFGSDEDSSGHFAAIKVFADDLGHRFYEGALEILRLAAAFSSGEAGAEFAGRVSRMAMRAHGVRIAGGTPDIQFATMATRRLGLPKVSS